MRIYKYSVEIPKDLAIYVFERTVLVKNEFIELLGKFDSLCVVFSYTTILAILLKGASK